MVQEGRLLCVDRLVAEQDCYPNCADRPALLSGTNYVSSYQLSVEFKQLILLAPQSGTCFIKPKKHISMDYHSVNICWKTRSFRSLLARLISKNRANGPD